MADPDSGNEWPGWVRPRSWGEPWRQMATRMTGTEPDDTPPKPQGAGRIVDCAIYANGSRQPGTPGYADAYAEVPRTPGAFVWLGLHEPTTAQMADVAEVFKLDPLAVEDAVTADARPKIERYGDMTLFVLRTTRYVEHPELTETSEVVETGLIMVYVGERFVITVRHGALGALGPVRQELEQQPQWLAQGPWMVAHAICHRLADTYLEVSTAIEVDIDALEEKVFTPHSSNNIAQIYQLKRELMEFKRAVVPLVRPMTTLADDKAFLPKETRRYFRDVNDHLQRVVDRIVAYDDLCTSILQARLAQVTVDQNNDMRKIASWAAIAATQTAIAGIYGMNFDYMPELQTLYGYPVVLTIMLGSAIVLHRMFRRSGWL